MRIEVLGRDNSCGTSFRVVYIMARLQPPGRMSGKAGAEEKANIFLAKSRSSYFNARPNGKFAVLRDIAL